MTEDEQRLAIEEAEQAICCGERCLKIQADGGCGKAAWRDEARAVLAPLFAKIAALEAENATLVTERDETARELHVVIESKLRASSCHDGLRVINRRFYRQIQEQDGILARAEKAEVDRDTAIKERDDARDVAYEARRNALEEAAKIAEDRDSNAVYVAGEIRALTEKYKP